jgi:E3 ubiquitin-protein ligase BAH
LSLGPSLPLHENGRNVKFVEISLSTDSRFFRLLGTDLSGLTTFQGEQEIKLKDEILRLGQCMSTITVPSKVSSKTDLFIWREIFRFYLDSEIFFSVTGNNRGILTPAIAHQRLQQFCQKLADTRIRNRFRKMASYEALDRFLRINSDLLRNLKFQELNLMAMTKILKSMGSILSSRERVLTWCRI